MFIDGLTNSGAIPALELATSFAARRHELIAHNIANADTPNFQPMDVDPRDFQRLLGEAVDARKSRRAASGTGDLPWRASRQIRRDERGDLVLNPQTPALNVLFHDRNNRDLERLMQDLAENTAAFRVTTDLLRQQHQQLQAAIAERV